MTTQPPDLKKLREVAEKATPGPWEYRENDGVAAVAHPKGWVEAVMPCGDQENKDAEFIATFNPQTILALLDAYEASARDAEIHDEAYLSAIKEVAHLKDENYLLRNGIDAVSCLIDNSHGVSGLHLNGDDAPWAELREGGRFETWLLAFDEATAARHATQGD